MVVRNRVPLFVAGLSCLAVGLIVASNYLTAQPKVVAKKPPVQAPAVADPNADDAKAGPALPITDVALFTSGVGFFQREGEVNGNADVTLSFPVRDINDLLKSLVVRDLGKGTIRAVGYDSQAPIEHALQKYVVNLANNPSYAQIVNQTRGEQAEVSWLAADAKFASTVTGKIVGIETKTETTKDSKTVQTEYLNLWSEKGLQSIPLGEVTQLRYLNPLINNEVRQALEVVASGHDTDQKSVRLQFSGKGQRKVQIGYIAEHPVWKTSYRLVLDGDENPYLQGWAIVENPTNEDWNDVRVRLVSGQPVSFRMDLYQPHYVPRPEVALPGFASLQPLVYEDDMSGWGNKNGVEGKMPMKLPASKLAGKKSNADGYLRDQLKSLGRLEERQMKDLQKMSKQVLQRTTQALAQGGKLGEQFQYVIDHKVSLPRQKSAMLPIVNEIIEGERVSIYNRNNLANNAMLGLKLKNNTKMHLMQGPITVFEQNSYAGDAIISDIQPGEERLLSYAVDLATEIKTESKDHSQHQINMSIRKGILHKTVFQRQITNYVIKNQSAKDKTIIIEHADSSPTWKLIEPKKAPEKSRSFYRFEVAVKPKENTTFPVEEERKVQETIALTNYDNNSIVLLLKNPAASAEMKKALEKAVAMKNKLAETQRKISNLEAKIAVIAKEQERQRNNMKVIPQTEPVYKKYLEKFLKQETQIDDLRKQIEDLQATVEVQRREYESYLNNLTVDGKKE